MSQKQKILQSVKTHLKAETSIPEVQIESLVDSISDENPNTPWWVIVLKVVAYAIGIILAGYGTASAATVCLPGLLG